MKPDCGCIWLKMKDGKEINAMMWNYKPSEGYCTIINEKEDNTIYFRDISEGLMTDRFSIKGVETRDFLEEAKRGGWSGK